MSRSLGHRTMISSLQHNTLSTTYASLQHKRITLLQQMHNSMHVITLSPSRNTKNITCHLCQFVLNTPGPRLTLQFTLHATKLWNDNFPHARSISHNIVISRGNRACNATHLHCVSMESILAHYRK